VAVEAAADVDEQDADLEEVVQVQVKKDVEAAELEEAGMRGCAEPTPDTIQVKEDPDLKQDIVGT
jgi:hypothetical protein